MLVGASRPEAPAFQLLPAAFRKLGWIEGKNVVFDWRFADGRPAELPRLAAELIQLHPDVIIATSTGEAEAAFSASHTIPIVVMAALDPVGIGLARSLAHPGGTVTGLLYPEPGIAAKGVQILFEAVPKIRRLAVLYDPRTPGVEAYVEADQVAADAIRLEVRRFPVRSPEEVAAALNVIEKERADAIKQGGGAAVAAETPRILAFAAEHRLPTVFLVPGPVERGGLLSYAPILTEYGDRAAFLVDRILKGANPADIPFEYPTRYELVINLKTAKALGIKIPQSVLLRADRLIE